VAQDTKKGTYRTDWGGGHSLRLIPDQQKNNLRFILKELLENNSTGLSNAEKHKIGLRNYSGGGQ